MSSLNIDAEGQVQSYVLGVLGKAVEQRASDVHFEPMDDAFRVRFRVDGVLREIDNCSKAFYESLITFVKISAHVDIAQKSIPQDGRWEIQLGGKVLDMRLSFLPGVLGTSLAIRLLGNRSDFQSLSELGCLEEEEKKLQKAVMATEGLIVVAGPTGSGKTTTLYTLLKQIDALSKKIITVEDPIESSFAYINQVEVRPDVGLTFESVLKSILRQSPDVILIGEIRDTQTAEMAMHAAATGHLVLTSLHADDTKGAIIRLLNLGIKPYLLAEYLNCVVAQRLIRQLCPQSCNPAGCDDCSYTGYKGRQALVEVMQVDEKLRHRIAQADLLSPFHEHTRTLGIVGREWVLKGVTRLEEISSVC